jgi:acetyl esterase/lipase
MNQKIAVTKTLEDIQHVRNQQIPITHELGTTKSIYLHDLFETKYSPEFYEDISVMENSSFSVTSIDANGVDAFWMENNSENVLLYFHGGAYLFGSPLQPQPFVISALSQNNLNVLTIDYRLVPEYSYPAAIEDGKSSYHYLLEKGYLPQNIVISGDSAGGGLVLGTMLSLRDDGEVLPAAIAVMSPWADLTLSGETFDTLKDVDKILSRENLSFPAQIYVGEDSFQNPYISPINGEFDDFPPVLIQIGSREVFLSDNTILAEKMKSDGVDVTFEVWDCMWHVFQNTPIPETKDALSNISSFFDEHLDS